MKINPKPICTEETKEYEIHKNKIDTIDTRLLNLSYTIIVEFSLDNCILSIIILISFLSV